ncbi:MAG TPA: hypothetical protein VLL97_09095 [Acidobacteriota bacterium]|nr:hypothetical protein [Acidobacteriota bacterium]
MSGRAPRYKEPLMLSDRHLVYELKFDCAACAMSPILRRKK